MRSWRAAPADGAVAAHLQRLQLRRHGQPRGTREPELRTVPVALPMPSTQRYMVCLRFNAKDSTGKYQGSRDYMVAFLSGRLDTIVPARREQCAKAEWQPFPELEKLRR